MRELIGLVVFLEDPDTIDPAKGDKETSGSASNREPGLGTTLWKRGRVRGWWPWGVYRIFKSVETIQSRVSYQSRVGTMISETKLEKAQLRTELRLGIGHGSTQNAEKIDRYLRYLIQGLKYKRLSALDILESQNRAYTLDD